MNIETMKYKVMWRNKSTGLESHGDWMDKEVAEAWLSVSQRNYPQLEYWLEAESIEVKV